MLSHSLDIIDLSKLQVRLNSFCNYQQVFQSSPQKEHAQNKFVQLQRQQSKASDNDNSKAVTIQFSLIQTSKLTYLNPKEILLCEVRLSPKIQLKVVLKLSTLFDLPNLAYYQEIDAYVKQGTKFHYQKCPLQVESFLQKMHKQSELNSHIRHDIKVMAQIEVNSRSITESLAIVKLGSKENAFSMTIRDFKCQLQSLEEIASKQEFSQKNIVPNFCNPLLSDFSYPLTTKLQTPKYTNLKQLLQLLKSTQSYQSPIPSSAQQLFVCHDMKGGYIEDTDSFIPNKTSNRNHSYRFDYLHHTQIFNYFSHYPITIPPKSWRTLCHQNKVLCLGTFIVENNELAIDEDDYITQEFALKLVYIAKKCQFDGWLINIEKNLRGGASTAQKLQEWLQFLTQTINQQISNSKIIWYDSIVANGQIQYQNALNPNNMSFYKASNGIFTNYWWKEQNLKQSMQYKMQGKSIFIGNDCFGRGTFGGGKYDLYKAINKIRQLSTKSQLQIALFAPGFTYEDNGEHSRIEMTKNENKIYRGSELFEFDFTKNWKITKNGGQGWKQEGQWAVTSFQICERKIAFNLKELMGNQNENVVIHFMCTVAGTGPRFDDPFKLTVQLYDRKNDVTYVAKQHPVYTASAEEQHIDVVFEIDSEIINDETYVKITEEGKDIEHWAGNYGARFKDQRLFVSKISQRKAWISSIEVSPIILNKNNPLFTTFFNKGEGEYFHFWGNKKQKRYDQLSDHDSLQVLSLLNPLNSQIFFEDSFIGGSCLKLIETREVKLLKMLFRDFESNATSDKVLLEIIIIVKDLKPQSIMLGTNSSSNLKQVSNNHFPSNKWKAFKAELAINSQKSLSQTQTLTLKTDSSGGFIGALSVRKIQEKLEESNTAFIKEVQISLTKHQISYFNPFCIDLSFKIADTQSDGFKQNYIVKVNNFVCFPQLLKTSETKQTGVKLAIVKEVLLQLEGPIDSIELQIQDLSLLECPKIIFSKVVEKAELQQLIEKGVILC